MSVGINSAESLLDISNVTMQYEVKIEEISLARIELPLPLSTTLYENVSFTSLRLFHMHIKTSRNTQMSLI